MRGSIHPSEAVLCCCTRAWLLLAKLDRRTVASQRDVLNSIPDARLAVAIAGCRHPV